MTRLYGDATEAEVACRVIPYSIWSKLGTKQVKDTEYRPLVQVQVIAQDLTGATGPAYYYVSDEGVGGWYYGGTDKGRYEFHKPCIPEIVAWNRLPVSSDEPPMLNGCLDAKTGKPLVWRGKTCRNVDDMCSTRARPYQRLADWFRKCCGIQCPPDEGLDPLIEVCLTCFSPYCLLGVGSCEGRKSLADTRTTWKRPTELKKLGIGIPITPKFLW